MTKPHIVLATPCFGGLVTHGYLMSVLRLSQWAGSAGVTLTVLALGGDSLICRARSTLVSHFLSSPEATHLLFVDADIAFEVEGFRRMLEFDQDFAAGLYPLKSVDWARLPERVVGGEAIEKAGLSYVGQPCAGPDLHVVGGFATGSYAGTGFQLIKRHVFERMIEAYPELKFRAVHAATNAVPPQDHLHALFACMIDPETGAYLSEDYSFCRRWRAIGGAIWLDLESRLTHTGTADFSGDCRQRFAGVQTAAAAPLAAAA